MPATLGVLTIELRVEEAHSLKDKRQVVQSLKGRLRNRFNVAIAEIDGQDTWQRAILALVTVGDRAVCEKTLSALENECSSQLGGTLVAANSSLETLESW